MAKLMKDQIRELIYKSSEEYLKLAEILEDDKDKFDCYLRAAELGNPQGQYKTGFIIGMVLAWKQTGLKLSNGILKLPSRSTGKHYMSCHMQ